MEKRVRLGLFLLVISLYTLALGQQYSIVPYDNLWNLSKQFYQDGFEWKRIWSANTYIQNPDLIYPGDILIIPGIGEIKVNHDGTYQMYGTGFDQKVASLFTVEETIDTTPVVKKEVDIEYLKIKEYLISPSMIKTIPYIHSDTSSEGFIEPGIASINDEGRRSYSLYAKAKVKKDAQAELYKEKLYTVVKPLFYKKLNENIVNVIVPVAEATVCGPENDSIQVERMWDVVLDSARIVPSIDADVKDGKVYQQDASEVEAKMFSRVNTNVMISPYEMIIIEGGKDIGIQTGDLFHVFTESDRKSSAHKLGIEVMAVKVQENTTTVLVTKVEEVVKEFSKEVPLIFRRFAHLSID